MSRRSVLSSIVGFLSVTLCLASGQVQFSNAAYNSGDSTGTNSVVNGDFDNDGILDLITINASTLSFYKGLGAGKFANPLNQAFYVSPEQVLAADFNRDGRLDLAVVCPNCANTGFEILILLGNGNGTFTTGTNLVTANNPGYIALADFNGDHLPDIAVTECVPQSATCSTEVFLGQGNGTFKLSATLPYGGGPVVAGDFNADGHQDIALVTGQAASGELAMFLGNGNGTFQTAKLASFSYPVSLAVGDFYNNRIQSLAVLSATPGTGYYVTTAKYLNGAIALGVPYFLNITEGYFYSLAAGDLNGDFLDDVVLVGAQSGTTYPTARTTYLLGNGNGTFQSPVNIANYGQFENLPFIRDLNLDSRHDIGANWDDGNSRYGSGGGAFVLLNTNGTLNCNPPRANALSVRVCAPTNGQTLGTSVTFKGAGNAFNGSVKRMELWIDGKKIGQNLEDQLKNVTTVAVGKHTASLVAVDTFDNHISASVSFTVK
jgi:hypothetical protein